MNYEVLESIKNGVLFSSKYDFKVKEFQVPHFIVLANFAPDESKLFYDRWDFCRIALENLENEEPRIPVPDTPPVELAPFPPPPPPVYMEREGIRGAPPAVLETQDSTEFVWDDLDESLFAQTDNMWTTYNNNDIFDDYFVDFQFSIFLILVALAIS